MEENGLIIAMRAATTLLVMISLWFMLQVGRGARPKLGMHARSVRSNDDNNGLDYD